MDVAASGQGAAVATTAAAMLLAAAVALVWRRRRERGMVAVDTVLAGATMATVVFVEAATMHRASRVARQAWDLVTTRTIGERWNSGRGGGFQYRPRVTDTGVPSRNGIDAELLQQTVQAVVAAVTAATKAVEPSAAPISHAAVVDSDRGQQVGMPVAAPTTSQLPTVISQEPQDNQGVGAKGKENEGQGALKKKKEDKTGCFHCKKPEHYIDDCPTPFCDLSNNGNDGNDDANNGEESHGGGNAMDMDPKGVDEGNTSNNNDKEGTYENNGVEGMQVQSNYVDAIQIGTMNVQLTPTDYMATASTSGLPQVAGVAAAAGLPLARRQRSSHPTACTASHWRADTAAASCCRPVTDRHRAAGQAGRGAASQWLAGDRSFGREPRAGGGLASQRTGARDGITCGRGEAPQAAVYFAVGAENPGG
ncbi:hypothetical protein ACQ4PT_033491 [Festuca glaucescens]